jgi:hypothetical protein
MRQEGNDASMSNWEEELRKRYPPPNTAGITPYYFSLDGGGRELITDAVSRYSISLMLEIGCFLCGSSIQWLEAAPDLKIVGVDPWDAKFADILDRYKGNKVFDPCFAKIDDRDEFIRSVRANGAYASAVANVQAYGERFIPIKGYSPAVLYELADLGFEPGLVYFDSNKLLDDLSVCDRLFPDAILSGDDWTWGADQGFPVQSAVTKFCEERGYSVTSRRATWIIPPR